MKKFWCVLLAFCLTGPYIRAENKDPNAMPLDKWTVPIKDPGNPDELIQAEWASVVNVLNDKELDSKAKEPIIDRIISPVFDFELMGKLALGKTHWPKFDTTQREKFLTLFVKRLKTSYRDKIMLYENQQAAFEPAVKNKDTVQISMTLTCNDQKTILLYKLHKDNQSWKIYDVEIEGVSILLTYRSQFNDILSRGTVDNLLCQLEKSAESRSESSKP